MTILEKLLASKSLPELDPQSNAGRTVEELHTKLAQLADSSGKDLELIPSEHGAYVFIGHPPKDFSLAWIHDHQISRLEEMENEHHLSMGEQDDVQKSLQALYQHHRRDYRFQASVNGHTLQVLPSNAMQLDLHDIVERVLLH